MMEIWQKLFTSTTFPDQGEENSYCLGDLAVNPDLKPGYSTQILHGNQLVM